MKSSSFYSLERFLVVGALAAAIGYGVKSWLAEAPPVAVAVQPGEVKKSAGRDRAKPRAPARKPALKKGRTPSKEQDTDGAIRWLQEAEIPPNSPDESVAAAKSTEPEVAKTPGMRMSTQAWDKKFAKIHKTMHVNRKKPTPLRKEVEKELKDVEKELDEIDDVNAAEPIWKNFGEHPSHHRLVCLVLDGIQSSESTKRLAALSVYSPDETTRESAAKALVGRKPSDYGLLLIEHIREKLVAKRQRIDVQGEPSYEVLIVGDEQVDRQFLYPELTSPYSPQCGWNVYTVDSQYITNDQKLARSAYNRQQEEYSRALREIQIKWDLEQVDRINVQIAVNRARALTALSIATKRSFWERDRWMAWLASETDTTYSPPTPRDTPRVTLTEIVRPLYQPTFVTIPKFT